MHTKRWYFCPACCTVCNNLTLLSLLSLTICLASFSHLSPSIVTLVCCFLQCPHGGASHHFFFVCLFFYFISHYRSFFYSLPFLPCSCIICFSQCDGLSGWFLRCGRPLCKYACLSYTASLVTHVFLPLVSGFSSVKRPGSNP